MPNAWAASSTLAVPLQVARVRSGLNGSCCNSLFWLGIPVSSAVIYVVLRNQECSILKSFAELERASGVAGLDLPGPDIAYLASGFGCNAVDVKDAEELEREFVAALRADMPTVIVVPTAPGKAML